MIEETAVLEEQQRMAARVPEALTSAAITCSNRDKGLTKLVSL